MREKKQKRMRRREEEEEEEVRQQIGKEDTEGKRVDSLEE